MTNNKFPWYDDRTEVLPGENNAFSDMFMHIPEWDDPEELPWADAASYDTPKKIYDYLGQHVWKQDAAKKAAAIIAYNAFERGVKSNAMFVGPTGCGKTHTWRCLKSIFPGRIEIVDGSNLSLDGWKGNKKWGSLFQSPVFLSGKASEHTILVIDEADKMLSPKYNGNGENVSHSVQAEGLTMMEGTRVEVVQNNVTYQVDTSKISFVFCGAFSNKAADMAEKEAGSRIGFGAAPNEVPAYSQPMEEADLIEYGVMPEFMGRIHRLVNLETMTAEDFFQMTDSPCGPLRHIRRQYRASVCLTPQTRRELAEKAFHSGLGVRGMERMIRTMLDDAIFEDCNQRRFEF